VKLNLFPLIFLLTLALVLAILPGCGDDDDDDDNDDDDVADDDDVDDDDDSVIDDDDDDDNDDDNDDDTVFEVLFEPLLLDGIEPDPNPVTGATTPSDYWKIPFFRFRQNTFGNPPRPVKAILVLQTGYASGATDYFQAARDLITLADGDLEVWVTERRANLLEDQLAWDAAEEQKDPEIAADYYFHGLPYNGEYFQGFYPGNAPELEMISEWGMDLLFKDLRAIIEHVPQVSRATNVILGGYSRGARFTKEYASFQFEDGMIGCEELAGILMWDQGRKEDFVRTTEAEYLLWLYRIRSGVLPRFSTPNVMSKFFHDAQFYAMVGTEGFGPAGDPRYGPDGIYDDWGEYEWLVWFVTRGRDVNLSNESVFGLLMDDNSTFLGNFFAHLGRITGGTVGNDFIGEFPNEVGATYTWDNFNETTPEELVDMQKLLQLLYQGPGDFIEHYFPARFDADETAAGDLETTGTWAHDYLPFYTSLMDAPVYCLAGKWSVEDDVCNDYIDVLPPVRGQALPRSQAGFHTYEQPDWSHLEILFIEPDRNPFLPDLLDWIDSWTTGTVQVPEFSN
jgi:hypothetical protein